jgi:5-dehydro-4-deoxyglucarate dehydratase
LAIFGGRAPDGCGFGGNGFFTATTLSPLLKRSDPNQDVTKETMSDYAPADLAAALPAGLLSFPVTHFTADLTFDEAGYREHIDRMAGYPVAGLFAAGGTGEFFSLTPAEVTTVVRAAVQSAPDGVPILAPAGRDTGTAVELAQRAEESGADGVLLFPPYLTESEPEGLAAHVRQVCRSTSLGVIIYNRGNARYSADTVERLATDCENLIGVKDGIGDLEQMTQIYARMRDRLIYVGGLPTAEVFALPYKQLGLSTYSSAIFNFVPQFALDFFAAVRADDHDKVYRMLSDFVLPYVGIRNRGKGYAVSIVKAGMRAVGRSAGPVRPPLKDLDDHELAELAALISKINTEPV